MVSGISDLGEMACRFGAKPLTEPGISILEKLIKMWFSSQEIPLEMSFAKSHFVQSPIYLLTHCGLVTTYGDKDLGQHWLR